MNFVGAGVTAADAGGGVASVTVPGGVALQEEGAPVTGNPHATINFVGAGVAATDVGGVGTVTIPGGITGITVDEEGSGLGSFTTLNFVGAGVTAADAGGGVASVTIPGGAPVPSEFGDGSDGSATLDGSATIAGFTRSGSTYTSNRESFWVNLTVNSGVIIKTDGYIIYVNGTLTNNGNINVNGNDASGITPGAGTWVVDRLLPFGGAGGARDSAAPTSSNAPRGLTAGSVPGAAANTSNTGTAGGVGQGGGGGGGGVGGGDAGGTSGVVVLASSTQGDIHNVFRATCGRQVAQSVAAFFTCGSGGGGGGLGGTNGGSGGGAGGWMVIWAAIFAGSGTYEAKGGNGSKFDPQGGGGGGGGGSGGVVVLVSNGATPPTPVLTGGVGGSGGSLNGGAGGAGGLGIAYPFIFK